MYHNSCALRIPGLTAVGKDGLVKCCIQSVKTSNISVATDCLELEANESSESVTLMKEIILAKEDIIRELRDNKFTLNKTIKLLEEKIALLEKGQRNVQQKKSKYKHR